MKYELFMNIEGRGRTLVDMDKVVAMIDKTHSTEEGGTQLMFDNGQSIIVGTRLKHMVKKYYTANDESANDESTNDKNE